jgi:tRNA(Ile)-lysidine synthase
MMDTLVNFNTSLIPPDSSIVMAFSGGVDSTVCLDRLMKTRPDLTVYSYYLDHGIRQDTHADIAHVTQFCSERSIPVLIDHADIPALARHKKQSLEEAGRHVRYERLIAYANARMATIVVTAHHAGDQTESILMQLLTGTSGLRIGIHEKTEIAEGLMLVRPMLNVLKTDILIYADDHQLMFVDDSSNACLDFKRNKLRQVILPMIEQMINPRVDKALARLKQHSDDMTELLESRLDECWPHAIVDGRIRVRRLLIESRFIQTEIIKRFIRDFCPDYRLTYDRVQELLDFIIADRPPAEYELAGNWVMKRARRQAWIEERL